MDQHLKKIAAILLFTLYLSGVMGLTLTVHYCGDDLKYFSLAGEEEDNCCDEREKACGCCTDQVFQLKVAENHNLVKTASFSNPFAKIIAPASAGVYSLLQYSSPQSAAAIEDHAPPQCGKLRLHLRNSLLLI